jgi:hypothetical protein
MKKLILSCSLGLTTIGLVKAQLPRFDSLWVSPSQPVAGQDVGFLSRTTFPAADCHLVSYNLNQNMNTLTLHLYHFQGMLTMICQSQDSIYPGTYAAGIYQLMALLYYQGETVPRDTAWLTFTVLPQAGWENPSSARPDALILWPNPVPAGSVVNLEAPDNIAAIEVRDLHGRLLAIHAAGSTPLRTLVVPSEWSAQVLTVRLRLLDRPEPLTRRLVVW